MIYASILAGGIGSRIQRKQKKVTTCNQKIQRCMFSVDENVLQAGKI